MYKNLITFLNIFFLSIILFGTIGTACEGPTGSEGPTGEDGSMMYTDAGEPGEDVGDTGDFYLDQETGELYGPKDEDGWGEAGIVLMGEDGSQIYSGEGAPEENFGNEGDYYLDTDNYELYGPKTSSGWGSPLNLKGADGNANVTRYIFPGHDFDAAPDTNLLFEGLSEHEAKESAWIVYLFVDGQSDLDYYHVPGYAYGGGYYLVGHTWQSDSTFEGMFMVIFLENGTGEEFDQIEVIQIKAGETVDNRKQKENAVIPEDLDTSDYNAVAEYYGFGREQE